MPNVTISANSKWASLTIVLFTWRPGPLCLQGNEDDICKIWAWPFLIYNAFLMLSQGILPSATAESPLLSPSLTVSLVSSAPVAPHHRQKTPAAQLVCLTVCQTRSVLLSSSPASAEESSRLGSFTNTSFSLSSFYIIIIIGMKGSTLIRIFVQQLWWHIRKIFTEMNSS